MWTQLSILPTKIGKFYRQNTIFDISVGQYFNLFDCIQNKNAKIAIYTMFWCSITIF